MKTYKEMANDVLSHRDEFDKQRKIKRKKAVASAVISCFVLVGVLGVGALQSDWLVNFLPDVNPLSQEGGNNETENTDVYNEQTNISETQSTQSGEDEGNISSGISGWFIPVLPLDREIMLTGEKITEEEAREYFSENKSDIISSLSSSGVSTESIKISDKGYCHISYSGEEGKSFEIKQNFRDYIVYNGDNIEAIITLTKENGEIFSTPSFGAKWFDDYKSYLNAHKGEKLIYVYAEWLEIIIAPDNTYFNPMGYDASVYLEGIEKPYEVFYHEEAIYIP